MRDFFWAVAYILTPLVMIAAFVLLLVWLDPLPT